MKKDEFTKIVQAELNLPSKDKAEEIVDGITSSLLKVFEQGEGLTIRGFGSFNVKDRAARMGRNPQTGEEVEIKASKAVTFKMGKLVKEAVNK